MFKGHFITAYLQREIPMDLAVVTPSGRDYFRVGELVVVEPADEDTPAYIHIAAGADPATVLTNATHIIAQSDVTLNSHVPVERRDYTYSDAVFPTLTGGAVPTASTETKHVALFAITDKLDIIVDEITD